jgi:F0F1-type ATP synthase membrane subunit c/vacuolar-type H+-ATPase subunit K/predicted amidophosphoribosyltransferase
MLEDTVSGFLLFLATGLGAAVTALWAGMAIWTWRDIRARSRDNLAHITATALVALLNIFGLLVYLMLRPRETLAEAYERSLEEEALLQGIEEKPMCPGCGRPTQMAWQVCPYCHTRLRKPCLQCGQLLELAWTLCPYCTAVQAVDAAPRSRRRAPQPAPLEYMEGDGAIE